MLTERPLVAESSRSPIHHHMIRLASRLGHTRTHRSAHSRLKPVMNRPSSSRIRSFKLLLVHYKYLNRRVPLQRGFKLSVIGCADLVFFRVKEYGYRDSTIQIEAKLFHNISVPVELADVDISEMKYTVGIRQNVITFRTSV